MGDLLTCFDARGETSFKADEPADRHYTASDGSGRMDLPDAPADRAVRPRLLLDLWDGARAADCDARRRAESRARRHDAAVLGGPRAHDSARAPGDVRSRPGARARDSGQDSHLDRAGVGDAGRAVGRA